MENKQVWEDMIHKFGKQERVEKAIEEQRELIQELRALTVDDLIAMETEKVNSLVDEIADVELMMDSIKVVFDCERAVDLRKLKKLEKVKSICYNHSQPRLTQKK